MTPDQMNQLQRALDQAITALGVAGEAATLGKRKDAERALKEAAAELARCKEVLGQIRTD